MCIRDSNKIEEFLAEIFIPVYNDFEEVKPEEQLMGVNSLESFNLGVTQAQNLRVNIKLNKEFYNTRDKVNAQIEVRDMNGNPVEANISVSVVDSELVNHENNWNTLYQGNSIPSDTSLEPFIENIHISGNSMRTCLLYTSPSPRDRG